LGGRGDSGPRGFVGRRLPDGWRPTDLPALPDRRPGYLPAELGARQRVGAADPALLAGPAPPHSRARARAAAEAVAGNRRPTQSADDGIPEGIVDIRAGARLERHRDKRREQLHPAVVAADLPLAAWLDLNSLREQCAGGARDQHRVARLPGHGLAP